MGAGKIFVKGVGNIDWAAFGLEGFVVRKVKKGKKGARMLRVLNFDCEPLSGIMLHLRE